MFVSTLDDSSSCRSTSLAPSPPPPPAVQARAFIKRAGVFRHADVGVGAVCVVFLPQSEQAPLMCEKQSTCSFTQGLICYPDCGANIEPNRAQHYGACYARIPLV